MCYETFKALISQSHINALSYFAYGRIWSLTLDCLYAGKQMFLGCDSSQRMHLKLFR